MMSLSALAKLLLLDVISVTELLLCIVVPPTPTPPPLSYLSTRATPPKCSHLEVLRATRCSRHRHLLGLEDGVDGGALAHVGVAHHPHCGHPRSAVGPRRLSEQLQQLFAGPQVAGHCWEKGMMINNNWMIIYNAHKKLSCKNKHDHRGFTHIHCNKQNKLSMYTQNGTVTTKCTVYHYQFFRGSPSQRWWWWCPFQYSLSNQQWHSQIKLIYL